jgi:hypothetical protein
MGLKTALKLFGKALPAIIANGPALAEAVRQIKEALKKKPVPAEPAPQLPVPVSVTAGE